MICDFVMVLEGVDPFSTINWRKNPSSFRTEKYEKRKQALGQSRTLFQGENIGAKCDNIEPTRDNIISSMRQQAGGGKFDKAGVLCIFGSSNGAAVALAIAAALQDELSVNYICLADLPLFAGGRSPGIPAVGDCKALPPITVKRATSRWTSRDVLIEGSRVFTTLSHDVKAKVKENYFQHNGNQAKPHTIASGWYWDSGVGMKGEVHGNITNPGWSNIEKDMTGIPLLWKHANAGQYHAALDDFVKIQKWPDRWPEELAKF